MSTCSKCGKPIIWIKTRRGKAMPCDPDRIAIRRTSAGELNVITEQGEAVRGSRELKQGQPVIYGYTSHFATCPYADSFRRR